MSPLAMKQMREIVFIIKAYFDPFLRTTLDDWKHMEKFLKIEEHNNRAVIKAAGTIETTLRFILKGGGALLIRDNNREICLEICLENEFLTDLDSLISGEPGDIIIKSFEALQLVVMDRKHLLYFYKSSPLCSNLGRILAEQKVSKMQQIQKRYKGSIEQRYTRMLENEPILLQRAPQKYVATYMGISSQGLSRVRGKK